MVTTQEALALVVKLSERLALRGKKIKPRFDYLEADQPLKFATEKWKTIHASRYKEFSDNWCEVVASAPVDRLRVDGFRIGDDKQTGDERELWLDWQRAEMTAQSNEGFMSSVVGSRSAVIVWADDDGRPEPTWELPEEVIVDYAPGSRRHRRAALKVWTDDDHEYATLYLPDELWKWSRPASVSERARHRLVEAGLDIPTLDLGHAGWEPREVSDEKWPLPNPLGVVPVVEVLNRPRRGGQPISDIDGVMAMQDTCNLMWSYLFPAADHASMPARVITGGEPPKVPVLDDAGQVIGSRPAKMEELEAGRFLYLPGASGIDSWEAAKNDYFIGVIREAIAHIAAQTRTPGHYLLSNEKFANLNGDALTAAEVPLATKVENFQLHASPEIKEIAALMALVRNKAAFADQIRSTSSLQFVHWKDGAINSLAQLADAATKDRSIGISLRTILERRYGFTSEQIDREMERIREEDMDPVTRAFVDELGGAGAGADRPATAPVGG